MDTQKKTRRTLVVKEYSLHDLAEFYEMSRYRLRTRIDKHEKEIGKRTGYFYRAEQVRKIFELIPLPSNIEVV